MNQSTLVRMMNRVADLRHHLHALPRVQTLLTRVLLERDSANELHREIRLRAEPGIGSSGLINLSDAGMLQAAERFGFLIEPPQQGRTGHPGLDHFERYGAARMLLLRL